MKPWNALRWRITTHHRRWRRQWCWCRHWKLLKALWSSFSKPFEIPSRRHWRGRLLHLRPLSCTSRPILPCRRIWWLCRIFPFVFPPWRLSPLPWALRPRSSVRSLPRIPLVCFLSTLLGRRDRTALPTLTTQVAVPGARRAHFLAKATKPPRCLWARHLSMDLAKEAKVLGVMGQQCSKNFPESCRTQRSQAFAMVVPGTTCLGSGPPQCSTLSCCCRRPRQRRSQRSRQGRRATRQTYTTARKKTVKKVPARSRCQSPGWRCNKGVAVQPCDRRAQECKGRQPQREHADGSPRVVVAKTRLSQNGLSILIYIYIYIYNIDIIYIIYYLSIYLYIYIYIYQLYIYIYNMYIHHFPRYPVLPAVFLASERCKISLGFPGHPITSSHWNFQYLPISISGWVPIIWSNFLYVK